MGTVHSEPSRTRRGRAVAPAAAVAMISASVAEDLAGVICACEVVSRFGAIESNDPCISMCAHGV